MSLIIDALKKAQQLRLKGPEGTPILKYPHPDNKRKRDSKKQWILISAGLTGLCILLFILLRPASPPLAIQNHRAAFTVERMPSLPVVEIISPESQKEVVDLPKDEKPLPNDQTLNRTGSEQAVSEGIPYVGAALSTHSSHPRGEKVTTESNPFPNEKRRVSLIKQAAFPPPVTQKEEVPPKSIEVEREVKKDHTLTHSVAPSPAFEGGSKEHRSGSTLDPQPELGPNGKPQYSGRGVEGLTSDVLIHFNSGIHFYHQREFLKAIQSYQKVIELDPTYVEAYNNLGITYQMMGDMDRAFKAYEKAIEINPKYEKGYNNLGIQLFLKDRYEEAMEAFQKALAINSDNIESHINLGILFKKRGQLEKAIESYQTALAIDPFHKETHYNIALLHEQMENFELAINHYQQFIQLSSKSHPELVSRVQRHLNELIKIKK